MPELFLAERSRAGRFEDSFAAWSLRSDKKLKRVWSFSQRDHRMNLVSSMPGEVRVNDLTAGQVLTLDAKGKVTARSELGRPGGFTTLRIVVDLVR